MDQTKNFCIKLAMADVDPAIIYAIYRTGYVVTDDTWQDLPESVIEDWNTALKEYDAL